ncbi:MAG: heavy-metal-associated domain-containing protein [Haliscomenobacter sp.]|nr:heavy-metal-associated domain-containing protein [Haliscomenobacter sp.]
MKTIFAILIAVLGLSIPSVAQSGGKTSGKAAKGISTAEVKVYGNCGMCERRIEAALSELPGVNSAEWDSATDMLTVQFDKKKANLQQIKEKVASVGHDTDDVRAKDEVYDKLHGCCKYERPAPMKVN